MHVSRFTITEALRDGCMHVGAELNYNPLILHNCVKEGLMRVARDPPSE
jgi:hypothetical protein